MIKADFIWLVHPLDEFQIKTWAIMNDTTVEALVEAGPRIVDTIKDNVNNLTGYAISTPLLPKELLGKKKVREQLTIIKNMIDPTVPVGLGAWWATVTRKGELAKEILDNPIIDGYTGTVDRIVQQVHENLPKDLLSYARVCIIGGGEVGKRVYDRLVKEHLPVLFDKFGIADLKHRGYLVDHVDLVKLQIKGFDIGVCCTTATEDVIRIEDIPDGFKFIDDSYPHAIPKYEGRIDGGIYDAPYIESKWLIQDGKVYGCLMELIKEVVNAKK